MITHYSGSTLCTIANSYILISVQHHAQNQGGYGPGAFRNSRPFERNPTTWVPPAPMRNGTPKRKY